MSTPVTPKDDTFDISTEYNALRTIDEAWKALRGARPSSIIPDLRTDLEVIQGILNDSTELQDLFAEPSDGRSPFGFWILHKHHDITAGECMVDVDFGGLSADFQNITIPMRRHSTTQIATRWGSNNNDVGLEFRRGTSSDAIPLPLDMFNKFNRIMSSLTLPGLFGICLAEDLESDQILSESPLGRSELRMQGTSIVTNWSSSCAVPGSIQRESAWVVTRRNVVTQVSCTCTPDSPPTKTSPSKPICYGDYQTDPQHALKMPAEMSRAPAHTAQ